MFRYNGFSGDEGLELVCRNEQQKKRPQLEDILVPVKTKMVKNDDGSVAFIVS